MVFILGLCFGSFVNMLVYRTARRYQLESRKLKVKIGKRSFCDYCGRQLSWHENIPVVSWLVQKGRTSCCGKKLPLFYPIIEVMMGILFVIFSFKGLVNLSNGQVIEQIQSLSFQTGIQMLAGLIIITFLMFSALFDIKYMILPDFSTVILIVAAVILLLTDKLDLASLGNNLLSAAVSFGFLYFLYLVTNKKGMGFGDVKLAFFMGLFLGYPKIILAMYLAFISGALFGLILMIFKKADRKTKMPFGPFLILGVLLAWIFEFDFISWL